MMEHARGRMEKGKYATNESTVISNAQLHIQRPPVRAKESTVRVQDVSVSGETRGGAKLLRTRSNLIK